MEYFFQHILIVPLPFFFAEEAEQQLEGLISCAVASASTKMREVELLSPRRPERAMTIWLQSCDGKQHGERAAFKEDSFSSSQHNCCNKHFLNE